MKDPSMLLCMYSSYWTQIFTRTGFSRKDNWITPNYTNDVACTTAVYIIYAIILRCLLIYTVRTTILVQKLVFWLELKLWSTNFHKILVQKNSRFFYQKLLEKLCIELYKNHIDENVYLYSGGRKTDNRGGAYIFVFADCENNWF